MQRFASVQQLKNVKHKTNGNVLWFKTRKVLFHTWLFANLKHIWKQIIQPSYMVHAGATCSILPRKHQHICRWANICSDWCNPVTAREHSSLMLLKTIHINKQGKLFNWILVVTTDLDVQLEINYMYRNNKNIL